MVRLEDAETGEIITIDTSRSSFRQEYARTLSKNWEEFEKRLRRRGIDNFEFATDSDYVGTLQEFFRMREVRRNR